MRHAALVSALLAAGALSAAQIEINDIRGELGIWPANYEADGNDADMDDAWRIGAQWMRSMNALEDVGGMIYGLEAAITTASGDDIDSQALTADGHIGWAWGPEQLEQLHFEGTAFLGLGLETVDAGGDDDMSPIIEYGLRAAGIYTFDNRWQVGLDLRYLLGSQSQPEIAGDEFDWENDGLGVLALVGYRL